jgi:hypothetical protein
VQRKRGLSLFYGVMVRVLDGGKNGNLEVGVVNEKGERNSRMVRKFGSWLGPAGAGVALKGLGF